MFESCLFRWVFPKIMVPPNHPFVHRVFHYFHHPFWGRTHYFWFNTQIGKLAKFKSLSKKTPTFNREFLKDLGWLWDAKKGPGFLSWVGMAKTAVFAICQGGEEKTTRWWFQILFYVHPIWGNDPFWRLRIFFKWVVQNHQLSASLCLSGRLHLMSLNPYWKVDSGIRGGFLAKTIFICQDLYLPRYNRDIKRGGFVWGITRPRTNKVVHLGPCGEFSCPFSKRKAWEIIYKRPVFIGFPVNFWVYLKANLRVDSLIPGFYPLRIVGKATLYVEGYTKGHRPKKFDRDAKHHS